MRGMDGAPAGAQLPVVVWVVLGVLALWLAVAMAGPWLRVRRPHAWWALVGFPVAVVRLVWTWRRLSDVQGLSVSKRPPMALVGRGVVVRGRALRMIKPKLGLPRWRLGGLEVEVKLHPGQTPDLYAAAAESMAHAWRVHSVRALSRERGRVVLVALAWDPLAVPLRPYVGAVGLLEAVVGFWEDGTPWRVSFRTVPHWLIVGATRSGKSTFISALVRALAPQRVALVGLDLKGGLELAAFEPRFTALATDRKSAAVLLDQLLEGLTGRMALCRMAGVRSVWELPDSERPVPIVVLVDEVAELFLTANSSEKAEVAQVTTALLRVAQLGAALGVHLVVAGQRFGSDLGQGATALRAQLAGRACFRVSDAGTAEMALGDLDDAAVESAMRIPEVFPGLAVAFNAPGSSGSWMRARTHLVTVDEARAVSTEHAALTPELEALYAASVGGVGGE
ncbi:FtsK/SpoIIIE domain-containing protein [Kitasatospora viridis]|nr:FtsK/SpoIIIE domain-containing protein [Kitasatospora viridis]